MQWNSCSSRLHLPGAGIIDMHVWVPSRPTHTPHTEFTQWSDLPNAHAMYQSHGFVPARQVLYQLATSLAVSPSVYNGYIFISPAKRPTSRLSNHLSHSLWLPLHKSNLITSIVFLGVLQARNYNIMQASHPCFKMTFSFIFTICRYGCLGVLPFMYVYASHICSAPWRPEEGLRIPRDWSYRGLWVAL